MSPRLRRGGGAVPLGDERARPIGPPGLVEVQRDGPVALAPGADPDAPALDIAVLGTRRDPAAALLPPLAAALTERGHTLRRWTEEELADFPGADVVLATGWRSVPRALLLDGVKARARLFADHDAARLPASAERKWAEWADRQPLHALCATPWIAATLAEDADASVTPFAPGLDPAFRSQPTHRRDDLVLLHAPANAPHRGVALGLLALEELVARRPRLEVGVFGAEKDVAAPFRLLQLGVLDAAGLAHAYASATVGLSLSLTAPSRVGDEMLACGLSVVDLATPATTAAWGAAGPVLLTAPDPLAIADGVERLLDDILERADRSRAGAALLDGRTWTAAAAQVEGGLRAALAAAAA